jgi:L-fuculose-phosphate aldolase
VRAWAERRELLEVAQRLNPLGLNRGTSGNVSVRTGDRFLITPTGLPYEELRIEDLVEVRMDGSLPGQQRAPSSEWRIHRDLYATRADVEAVVHVHSTFATTLACLRKEIPAIHYLIARAGGSTIRCAEYATFGTEALSANTLTALQDRTACLLANHGMVAVGSSLSAALALAVEVEGLAEQYWRALQAGTAHVLDEQEMAVVLERFKTYGQPGPRRRS